jgi:hypothetical protein
MARSRASCNESVEKSIIGIDHYFGWGVVPVSMAKTRAIGDHDAEMRKAWQTWGPASAGPSEAPAKAGTHD